MTMAYFALKEIVTSPLIIPKRWRDFMGKFDAAKWLTVAFGAITLGIIGGQLMFGAGGWMSGQSKDIIVLQAQYRDVAQAVASLKDQVTPLAQLPGLIARLNDRLDAAPRTDLVNTQLTEIQRHLSALDGRMDGMDTRSRADEDRLTRTETKVEGIDASSRAKLGR